MQSLPSTYKNQLQELFLNKSDLVIDFPKWLLSHHSIENYRSISKLAMVEIAGRDSIAAAVKSIQEYGFTDLLPTYVYTGTDIRRFLTSNDKGAFKELAPAKFYEKIS